MTEIDAVRMMIAALCAVAVPATVVLALVVTDGVEKWRRRK